MLGTNLNVSLKLLVQKSVVDGNHITKLQVRRDLVDAIERGLIKNPFIDRPLDEHKLVVVKIDQFLRSIVDQAHWHCIQQFVRKMDSREWFQRVWPLNLIAERLKVAALPLFQNWKWLEYPIVQRVEEFRQTVLHELENIQRELPVVRPLLDNHEMIELAEALPDLAELRGQ